MLKYTNEQLATIIAIPIVTILLVWTLAIFHKNRKHWGAYDIPIVAVVVLSIIRNLTILAYTLVITLNKIVFDVEHCSVIIWIFNSIHTFQASSLTTIAVIGLFSAKLHRKNQNLRQFLTATHVVYHLFCLTTLCACVGVAAILAQNDRNNIFQTVSVFEISPCKFMPFDLDVKFNVFILVLHLFLALVSLCSFILICYNHLMWRKNGFDYLKKSNSDLSDLSLGLAGYNENKNYFDSFGNRMDFYDGQQAVIPQAGWNSDMSNLSATVSSTNSRRPCIAKQLQDVDENRTGLETIHPVLIVCYLFYHLPLIVLCIYPRLIAPWPVAGLALWLGLLQDVLIPVGLGLVDSRFCKWVSNVYKCSASGDEKLPHVGLDGKFRPFTSPPQSLEAQNQDRSRGYQTVEHRFPITNGSLYTSIDGRLPVIHNYRRNKDQRAGIGIRTLLEKQSSHVALHSNHLKRGDFPEQPQQQQKYPSCGNCETDLCPSHSNLHHLSPHYSNKKISLIDTNLNLKSPKRISLSQESISFLPENIVFNPAIKNSRNLLRLKKIRLSKSEDSLSDIRNPVDFKEFKNERTAQIDFSSDDEEFSEVNESRNFDSLSSKSCYSITTEANCDFEFYQNKEIKNEAQILDNRFQDLERKADRNFRITRSNSKRSLENFQAYVEEGKIQRSNSYMTLEDRKRRRNSKKLLRSDSKLSDCTHSIRHKIKSVEYLPDSNSSTVYVEDFNLGARGKFVGSVPDFKKVFISEYI